MLSFIINHFGTIFVGGLVLLVVFLIVLSLIKNRKHNKSACGCHCSQCPSAGICHSNK